MECGKSTVCKLLKQKFTNSEIISADEISKDISNCQEIIHEIAQNFGNEVLETPSRINTAILSSIVFKDKLKLKVLNSIMHPRIMGEIKNRISISSAEIIILDVPIPINEFIDLCNKIIVVTAPLEIRINRIMKRSSLSKEQAILRINSQMSEEEYKKCANIIIENNNDIANLEKTIDSLEII